MWAVVLVAALVHVTLGSVNDVVYTNDFAVEIEGGDTVADLVAGIHGCRIKRALNNLGGVYVFRHPQVKFRHKRSAEDVLEKLRKDPNVKYVEQQKLLKREKRQSLREEPDIEEVAEEIPDLARRRTIYDKQLELPIRRYKDPSVYQRFNHEADSVQSREFSERDVRCKIEFTDPFYPDQWYLNNLGQSGGPVGYDVNVQCVWKQGITGKGIVVTILDDGLDHTHPDLIKNYDPKASTNMNDLDDETHDPQPNLKDPSNTHGTRCAGEVAAQANNSVCGVGIAFNARIGGVRILDGPVTDTLEAAALNFKMDYIDLYSASWGPPDNGKTMETPGKFCKQALKTGVEKGRGGKGSIFVWATGNGGMYGDTCSCDGYVSSIYTLSIGCISDEGLSTYFSEVCPSTMSVIFTGGAHKMPGSVRERNPRIKVVTTDPIDGCTLEFQGTSSAAPLAAGCLALVLEANPDLTWRDMQHIVVITARVPNPSESGWIMNGAGFHLNDKFGFGVLDCGKMVEVAQEWVMVPEQHTCIVKADTTERIVPPHGNLTTKLYTTGCAGNKDDDINYLEHVEVHIELEATRRGDVNLFLISPHKTPSEILRKRRKDDAETGIDFTFMSVFNWGEDPKGDWMLVIIDRSDPDDNKKGNGITLQKFGLTLYGTAKRPKKLKQSQGSVTSRENSQEQKKSYVMNKVELQHELKSEEVQSDNLQLRDGPEKGRKAAHTLQKASRNNNFEDIIAALGQLLEEDKQN